MLSTIFVSLHRNLIFDQKTNDPIWFLTNIYIYLFCPMVDGRFHQETKTGICFVGILDFEVRLGSASSLLELCPRRKTRQTGKCFAGLGEASVIFCPWLQEMFWDLVKLWWKFSNVAMDHQSWSQKVCQEGLGLKVWVMILLICPKSWSPEPRRELRWWFLPYGDYGGGIFWPKTPDLYFF